jgi:hypothetical protein
MNYGCLNDRKDFRLARPSLPRATSLDGELPITLSNGGLPTVRDKTRQAPRHATTPSLIPQGK